MIHTNDEAIKPRINRIQQLLQPGARPTDFIEAASLAQSVLSDTCGGAHPLMGTLVDALKTSNSSGLVGGTRALLTLYHQGTLTSARLQIAHEIQGSLLDIAEAQTKEAEQTKDTDKKLVSLGVAAFLAGAALEDALRRLCDAHGVIYDPQHSSIAKMQSALYQPSKSVEIITQSENKHITAWGDTRNKADHGKFVEITHTEVLAMILGTRGFIDKYLP